MDYERAATTSSPKQRCIHLSGAGDNTSSASCRREESSDRPRQGSGIRCPHRCRSTYEKHRMMPSRMTDVLDMMPRLRILRVHRIANIVCALLVFAFVAPASGLGQAVDDDCLSDIDCERMHGGKSRCIISNNPNECNRCSNPFTSGCLANLRSVDTDIFSNGISRVCNRDDDDDDDDDGNHNNDENGEYSMGNRNLCIPSAMNYTEIRVHNADWESPLFYSWIIQIFLSEFLRVPVRVGMADDTRTASFYNPDGVISFSSQTYAFDAIETANRLGGDCTDANEPCIHVMPEVWIGQEKAWKEALANGQIDQVNDNGQVGKISWYIPHYTARRYPQFLSYHGMANRREELAAVFQRPTTWEFYCLYVSSSKCLEPDGVTNRRPVVGEEDMYFKEGEYLGHFQLTDQNNCTAYPDTCTGHIVGAPCTWSTNLDGQAYHNDIALESDGYLAEGGGFSYSQMLQIWRAANHTKSDIIMWWWTPDATIEEFRGTDFELQRVLLPEPTSTCRNARVNSEARCSSDQEIRRGVLEGACDNAPNSLQKVVASSLRDMTLATPEASRSPGYQAILNLKVSQLSMNTMMREWVSEGRTGFAAREAVCKWVVQNKEELESYIPTGYPRTLNQDSGYQTPALYTAMALGGVAVISVLVCLALVYRWRSITVFARAQVVFVVLILLGLLVISVGAVVQSFEPTGPICISQVWLVTLGYTLELVPLLVKVSAINRLMQATKDMKHIRIRPRNLLYTVAFLVAMIGIFLTVWTIIDPPDSVEQLQFTDDQSVLTKAISCGSASSVWYTIALCWEGLLIFWATVLAIQSRKIKREFNKRTNVGILIYSHFVFFLLRTVAINLGRQDTQVENDVGGGNSTRSAIQPTVIAAALSFLISLDVLTALGIYVIPKLYSASTGKVHSEEIGSQSRLSFSGDIASSMAPDGSSHAVRDIVAKAQIAMSQYSSRNLGSSLPSAMSVNRRSSYTNAASESEVPDNFSNNAFDVEDKDNEPVTKGVTFADDPV